MYLLWMLACATAPASPPAPPITTPHAVEKTDAEWRASLSPEAYAILRQKSTERAFTGKYWNNHEDGTYVCAGCGLPLFDADDKFESGTGWPSYTRPIQSDAVEVEVDRSYGMVREEVLCHRCGGHLGHVFDDGPAPTGRRYCINSAALEFQPAQVNPGSPAQ